MIKDIKEINFPKREGEEKSYATLAQATATLQDMAEKTITAQVKIDGGIAPDFSYDWEIEFKGEKYIMPLREPQAAKENTSLNSTIDLTFQHWAVYQLKRWYFFTVQPVETGTAVPDKYIASVTLNLGDFCALFRQVLNYYYGDTITIDLNPAWQYSQEPVSVEISHSYIWDVLIKFYELFAVRWQIEPNGDTGHYVIKVGYPAEEISHIFEYGFEGGLLKVERQVQDDNIRNMLIGRGGSKNLPYRYFKNTDPDNPDFKADPDWIPELASIYFSELRGATFRSYIQGWKTKHYGGASVSSASGAYAPWAWMRGYTDAKFNPVEYVADEFGTGENGYNVVTNSSIAKYGPLLGGLENNDDIYPSMRVKALAVEQVQSDDVEEAAQSDAETTNLSGLTPKGTRYISKNSRIKMSYKVGYFTIPEGKTGNLDEGAKTVSISKNSKKVTVVPYEGSWVMSATNIQIPIDDASGQVVIEKATAKVVRPSDNSVHPASGIPAGDYYFLLELELHNTTKDNLSVTVECAEPKVTYATLSDKWAGTFDVWAGNIWGTARESGETPAQYAERVWRPILGDREGNEAKVLFATGQLAASEDYEFTIVSVPEYDDTVSFGGEQSHWRLTLAKSDADLESLGLYVPSTKRQGSAGDQFLFIGIDMPHKHVTDAEIALDDWKKDELLKVKGIKPSWVVALDKVRIHNYGEAGALADSLRAGAALTLFDKRFIPGSHEEKLYLQSVTYTYNEPTETEANIIPDVEVVLSDKYETTASPVATLQGQIDALQRQVGSISNIQQVVRAVGDKLYLRKDGIADRSMSPTEFASLLTSYGFRSGIVGGQGWGFYRDESGKWVLETDRVNVRQDMQVNNLVINQITARGGMIVESAASMEITEVEEAAGGYVCRFDQKEGSVGNLFHEGDVAYCSRFTPQNEGLKYYKRRVLAADDGSVTLSKTEKDGTGIPEAGDVIVHYGSYTDPSRRYVKVRDVIGGGYERYIEGLDSVTADGKEYYFVGRQDGSSPRWFIGDLAGEYAEYKDRKLTLKCALSIESTVGGKDLVTFVKENGGLNEDVKNYVNSVIQGVQDQIDGVIETWFFNGVPTLASYPASEWGTEELKIQHLGDLYYDNDTGTAYRFSQKADKTYYWNVITDDAITKALKAAKNAQDTADGKRRVFVAPPVPPYDEGDLWVNATYPADGTLYSNDILRCKAAKAKGAAFSISDWERASKYTDDTEVLKLKYIKDALKDFTLINGGLVLSSLISLGLNNKDITSQTTYSGISGLYNKDRVGGGIAAWYGGDMLDLAEYYDWDETAQKWVLKPGVSVDGLRIAQGLDRMDGTGYRAGGSIWWDADGMVHADPLSFFVGEESVGNVLGLFKFWPVNNTPFNRVTAVTPQRPFTELRIGTTDGTKSVRLTYDENTGALRVEGNMYSDGDITALGSNPLGGSGSGGGSGVDGMYFGDWTDYAPAYDTYAVSGRSGKALYDLIRSAGGVDGSKLGLLTLTRNGVEIGRYNPAVAASIDISVPTKTSQLANDSGFLAGITKAQVEAVLTGNITSHTHSQYLTSHQSLDGLYQMRGTTDINTDWNSYGGRLGAWRTSPEGFGGKSLHTPQGVYKYGLLVNLGTTTKVQMYFPHNSTANIQTRISWNGTDAQWTSWSKLAYLTDLSWANLAGKPTTLAGFGITDAVTLGTTQRVTGTKTFTDIRLDGQPENTAMPFFLGIDAYADGGAVKYITASKVANAISVYTKAQADGKFATISSLDSYFKTNRGAIPTAYIDLTNYSANASGYANYASGTYSVPRSGFSELFVNLALNSNSTSALQFLTSYGDSNSLRYRKTIDFNRVSGPWRTILTELNIGNFAVTLNTAQTITGVKTFAGGIRIGSQPESGSTIYFYGNTGDGPGSFNHAWISERKWGGTESSELVIFKGNDNGNSTSGTAVSVSGPDRIRHIAASHVFQSYTSALAGDVAAVSGSSLLKTCFDVSLHRTTSYNPLHAPSITIGSVTISYDSAAGGLKIDGNAYTTGDFSALGANPFAGGSSGSGTGSGTGASYDRLDAWGDYSSDKAGWVLSALLGYDLHTRANTAANNISTLASRLSAVEGKYVTIDTAQTITGVKTFTSDIKMSGGSEAGNKIYWGRNTDWAQIWFKNASDGDTDSYLGFQTGDNNNEYFRFSTKLSDASADTVWATIKSNGITANSFIKSGGTSSQVLMADGSVKTAHVLSSITSLGWDGTKGQITTINTIAHWNGCYSGTSSNLAYCRLGAFGNIVTHSAGEFVTSLGTSGNYLTWTKNGAVNNITVPYATAALKLNSRGNLAALTGHGMGESGVNMYQVYNNGYPTTYGNLLHVKGIGAGELLMGWSGTDGGYAGMYYRNHRDNEASANWSDWVTILDSHNYSSILDSRYYTESEADSRFVNVSGDIMSGDLRFADIANGTFPVLSKGIAWAGSTDGADIRYKLEASDLGVLRLNMVDDGDTKIAMSWNGTTKYDFLQTQLNATGATANMSRFVSNVGTGTQPYACNSTTLNANLNADLLDGFHYGSFEGRFLTVIDATKLDNNTWYPVTMAIGNSVQVRIRIEGRTSAPASWNSRSDKAMAIVLDYTVNGSFWGWTGAKRVVHQWLVGAGAVSNAVCGLGQLANSSNEYVFVRGGAVYNFYLSRAITPVLRTSAYTSNSQTVQPTTTQPALIQRTNALITDNVASATKLQTARTLWGQSFDGTANVSGELSGCTRIKNASSGQLYLGNSDNSSWVLTQDICSHSAAGDSYWSLRTNGTLHCKKAHIGTATDTYVLNTASFICDSWVRTKGSTGWYNETYGGGFYMSDSTWIRNYGNKPLYMNTAEVRTDRYFNREGYGGNSWGYGYGAYNVAIANNNQQTPLMVAYRAGQSPSATGANRLFAMELLNNGKNLRFQMVENGATVTPMSLFGTGNVDFGRDVSCRNLNASNSINSASQLAVYNASYGGLWMYGGTVNYRSRIYARKDSEGWDDSVKWLDVQNDLTTHFYHNVYSNGDITALGNLTTSDMRLKNVIRGFALSLDEMASAPLFIHTWKDGAPGEYAGTSAQYWQAVLPQAVKGSGKLALDYGKAGVAMGISISRLLRSFKNETKEDIAALKRRVSALEKENKELRMKLIPN